MSAGLGSLLVKIIDQQALNGCIEDVVLKHVVGGVVLNLKFARTGVLGVVRVKRVVEDGAVVGPSNGTVVSANGDSHHVAVIDQIASGDDVAGDVVLVFTGHFDSDIGVVHQVPLDD